MKIDTNIKKEIFREYDLRGIYEEDLTEDVAYTLGRSYASYIEGDKVVIGYDNRVSSPVLSQALMQGLMDSGAHVINLGMVTTPMFYFAKKYLKIPTGIMVTASHNPGIYNGFKLSFTEIGNACGDEIRDFYDFTVKGNYKEGMGNIESYDIKTAYLEEIKSSIQLGNRKLKVVVDLGNGVASVIVKQVLDLFGIEYYIMNEKKDLSVVSNYLDPSKKSLMIPLEEKVKELGYDIGIGLDGDADRVGLVDEKGNHVSTENYMIIMYRELNKTLPLKKALFDVKCSKTLIEEITRLGLKPVMYRTGNSYVGRKMIEDDFLFGGEFSGHMFFRDKWKGFDDGLYNGLRMVELLSHTDQTLSQLYDDVPILYQTEELLFPVSEKIKFQVVDAIKEEAEKRHLSMITIDGIRVTMESFWFLIRASNTSPNLTVRIEADDPETLKQVTEVLTRDLNHFIENYQA